MKMKICRGSSGLGVEKTQCPSVEIIIGVKFFDKIAGRVFNQGK
jgi:hypothetical protein